MFKNTYTSTIKLLFFLFCLYQVSFGQELHEGEKTDTVVLVRIDSLNDCGRTFYVKGLYYDAVTVHKQALKEFGSVRDARRQCITLRLLAQSEVMINENDSAFRHAGELLFLARTSNQQRYESDAQRIFGDVHYRMSEYDSARHRYEAALEIASAIQDTAGIGFIIHNLANVYADQGQFDKALQYYFEGLSISKKEQDTSAIGKSFFNIGLALLQRGNSYRSIEYLDTAKLMFEQIRDSTYVGSTLIYLGLAYLTLGHQAGAMEYLQEGLNIAQRMKDTFSIATAIGSLGDMYSSMGDYTRAIQHILQAQSLFLYIGNPYNASISLLNIGQCYYSLGDFEKSLEYFRRALTLKKELGDQQGIGITLANIGAVYLEYDSVESAYSYFNESYTIGKEIHDLPMMGRAYTNLGETELKKKNFVLAERKYHQALTIFQEAGLKLPETETLNSIGRLKLQQGQIKEAEKYFQNALTLATTISNPENSWKAKAGLGDCYSKRKLSVEALNEYEAAIDILEGVRSRITLPALRSAYVSSTFSPYEGAMNIYGRVHKQTFQRNTASQSFNLAERSKAQSLLEILTDSHVDMKTSMSSEQRMKESELLQTISSLQTRLWETNVSDSERSSLNSAIEQGERELENFYLLLPHALSLLLSHSRSQSVEIQEVQSLLHDGEALIEYSLGMERSLAWFITRDTFTLSSFPGKDKVESGVKKFLSEISIRPSSVNLSRSINIIKKLGAELFGMLCGPISSSLKTIQHLYIVPDGILWYLPFEALSVVKHANPQVHEFFFETTSISYVPSATILHQLYKKNIPRKEKNTKVLAIGDPIVPNQLSIESGSIDSGADAYRSVFDDYIRKGLSLSRLPMSREELLDVVKSFPDTSVTMLTDSSATEKHLKSLNLQTYRYLHFATHGFVDNKKPERSGIVLSPEYRTGEDGLLQTREIYKFNLQADLVVLSACETGIGKLYRGEGMVGLSYAFFSAGSRSLIVSLWSVSDRSTAALMKELYQKMSDGTNPAEALRKAKLSLLHSSVPVWQHPFHWGGFVFEGLLK